MRTGEFAALHNVTYDTVRHYIELGLLVAEKKGGQYRFTPQDSKDLEKVIYLKQLDFTLSEIQTILCFQRLAGEKTDEFQNHYLSFLESKRDQIKQEEQRCRNIATYLDELIEEVKFSERSSKSKLGFPVNSLNLLKCPVCNNSLALEDGIIEKNMIIRANIKCKCEYNAIIQNGIYIDKKAVRQKLLFGKPMPTKEEYIKASSAKYINFLYSGMTQLVNNLKHYRRKPEYIMELDNCVSFFLMHYIKELPKDTTYIMIDYDLDRLTKAKQNLENHHKHKNFIFFCCDINRLPIANGKMDIIVDNLLSSRYGTSENKFLLDDVIDLVKENGLITGTYRYFKTRSRDFIDLNDVEKKYFSRNYVLDRLMNLQINLLDIVDSGPIIEHNPYSLDISGKELYHASYVAKKKAAEELKSLNINEYMVKSKIS